MSCCSVFRLFCIFLLIETIRSQIDTSQSWGRFLSLYVREPAFQSRALSYAFPNDQKVQSDPTEMKRIEMSLSQLFAVMFPGQQISMEMTQEIASILLVKVSDCTTIQQVTATPILYQSRDLYALSSTMKDTSIFQGLCVELNMRYATGSTSNDAAQGNNESNVSSLKRMVSGAASDVMSLSDPTRPTMPQDQSQIDTEENSKKFDSLDENSALLGDSVASQSLVEQPVPSAGTNEMSEANTPLDTSTILFIAIISAVTGIVIISVVAWSTVTIMKKKLPDETMIPHDVPYIIFR